jgi:translation initiation factor IF-3
LSTYKINNQIKQDRVRLIGDSGEHLGEKSLQEALSISGEKGLDLVEMNPHARPPVCKIMDFGKFLYRQAKEQKKQEVHTKKNKMKILKIGVSTGLHDLQLKQDKAKEFLKDGDRVRIEMTLRGREKAHVDFAADKLKSFLQPLQAYAKNDFFIKRMPSGLEVDLMPL